MKARGRNQGGGTLLEMTAVLAVLGVVMAGALSILPDAVRGMILARDESAAAENIQAALTRITHEVSNMDTKRPYSFTSTSITYYYRNEGVQSTISLSGTNLTLNGNVLLGNLVSGSGFQVSSPNYIASPAVPAGVTLNVRVPGLNGMVTKTYTTKIEFNTQRFQ
ncbi:MAG: PulJ/GspJ family protein [Thermodesulfobacteriota bacterium]